MNKIEKKDLSYWIVILIVNMIWIITVRLGDNADVINYISFGGMILSGVLAIIAIIYTFFVNAINVSANEKLADSAAKIEAVTEILNYSGLQLSSTVDSIEDLKKLVYQLNYEFGERIGNIQGGMGYLVKAVSEQQSNSFYKGESFSDVVRNLLMIEWPGKYFEYLAMEDLNESGEIEFFNFHVSKYNNPEERNQFMHLGYCLALIVVLEIMGYVETVALEDTMKIIKISDEFKAIVLGAKTN